MRKFNVRWWLQIAPPFNLFRHDLATAQLLFVTPKCPWPATARAVYQQSTLPPIGLVAFDVGADILDSVRNFKAAMSSLTNTESTAYYTH